MPEHKPIAQQPDAWCTLAQQTTEAMQSWYDLFQMTNIAGLHMVGMGVYTTTALLKTNTHLLQTLLENTFSISRVNGYAAQTTLLSENGLYARQATPLDSQPITNGNGNGNGSLAEPTIDSSPEVPVAATTPATNGAVDSVVEVEVSPPQPPRREDIGAVGPEAGFYFTGPTDQAHHAVHNLTDFVQQSAVVDDTTWIYHLHRGDYSNWFRYVVADAELADAAAQIEQEADVTPADSRDRLQTLITERYAVQV
jgi:hypothetical protein